MTECLIVGAGIVGLSTAYELKKKGHNVTIVDNNKKGQSSKAAAGILFPLSPWENLKYMQELCISGHNEYNKFLEHLNSTDKKKIGCEKKNLIIFGKNIELAKKWYRKNKFVESNFIENKLAHEEKNIKEKYENYLLIKNINTINPQNLIGFYKKILLENGVIFKNENICNIHDYVDIPKNHIYDFVIVTTGSWSKEIFNEGYVNVKPIKGQLLHFKTKEKLLHNILLYNEYYILPRGNNNIIVGATLEDVGFKNDTTLEAENNLKNFIYEIFNKNIKIRDSKMTFGFRPYSVSGKPYINVDSRNKRIIYNFGHYRYGILTAISSAKVVEKFIK
ncbi:FAD-binding oxidoreductase [Gammaproteobacteria bacterium]|nr:FAD-binding oxidoreductase [Gammaproteobacteria bacterium]